ncbi:hypothetical protein ACJIZ3_013848 [Penstemon smallii]|uniref:NAB domain-containing protein n=1 Tax=Penstemon smallii TaxID=265156 RepID=A0ABD3RUA6_9LAMI
MATLQHSESRRLYSWWWDSHNSPKNSKWLQENIQDMDSKVKTMIKLIEEDADSFARRAEMYYKKRPELMKLVEEFYRAYRALAERYNHATGELRHAHRTIAKAFPDQVPLEFVEDSPSKSPSSSHDKEPHTPETKWPARALFDDESKLFLGSDVNILTKSKDDLEGGMRKRGLKKFHEIFGAKEDFQSSNSVHDEMLQLSKEMKNLKDKNLKAESEVLGLKKALADMEVEKEDVLLEYQRCLERLSSIEGELCNAQKDSIKLGEKSSRAEIEVQTLKEALLQLEAEKNAELIKHKEYLEKIFKLEVMISRLQEDNKGLDNRANEAESEAQALKNEISRLELEKEEVIHQYKQCLGKISDLENVISVMEDEARLLKMEAEGAEIEVLELKKALSDLKMEKEASALRYKCCLETISKLEKDLFIAKEEIKRLNNEVLIGTAKLENAEEKCTFLEMSNQSLRIEADNLSKKIAMKDLELSEKLEELEKLQTCMQNEHLHHAKTEATLLTLENLHSKSQDDQRALALELKSVLRMLNELEVSKNGLEEEISRSRDENRTLSQTNLDSVVSMEKMQNEILSLREIKERLEKEVLSHMDLSNSLHREISCLKEEIEGLKQSYQALIEQVRCMHDDNSNLRQICEKGNNEKDIFSNKLQNMEELLKQKSVIESDLNCELESSQEKVKTLQESCQILHGEKGTLAFEKASLMSQLQAITENMHNLLEKNAVLENSLSTSKVELEGLREKSKGLESICELLKNERSYLLIERDNLAFKLENVERRLESLEKRCVGLEEKNAYAEKEKEAMHCKVEELEISLSVEKQERTSSQLQSETRLSGLENQIRFLQEENRWKKKEFEDELDKALKAQFEISILQKFIKDMEEKNYSLIIECQKHVEASKLAEKLISELESESLEQQVESELLLDEIERLRLGIYQVFRALETDSDCVPEDKFENEQTFVHFILENVEDMKCSISKHEDDKQLLLVENSVLLTLLEQLESKGTEIEVQKCYLEKEFKTMEEAYSQVKLDNKYLLKKFSDLKEEKYRLDQYNDAVLLEFLEIYNQSSILKSFGEEKITEVKLLLEDMNRQYEVNDSLVKETNSLKEKLELENVENVLLKEAVHKFEMENRGMRESCVQMKQDMLKGKESLLQTEAKLLDTEMKLQESMNIRENLEKNVLQLSENNESLNVVNTNLKSEVCLLREEIEEKIIREQTLSLELKDKTNEFELWEAEASSFYFDLQISSVNEVLFENKVHELTGVCQILENERVSKASEIEEMKGEICSMRSEIMGLKSQISAYAPVVDSLRDDITILEHNAILQTKVKAAHNHEAKSFDVPSHPSSPEILAEDQSLLSLKNLQMRIKAVGKLMEEKNNPVLRRRSSSKIKEELVAICEIEKSKPRRSFTRDKHEASKKKGHPISNELSETPKLQKIKTKGSEVKIGMLMKDIPLDQVTKHGKNRKKGSSGKDDQMLELWETAEGGKKDQTIGESLRMSYKMTERDIVYDQFDSVKHKSEPPSTDSDVEKELGVDKLQVSRRSTEINREVNNRIILERLASDAQKLESLQTTVESLRMKLDTNKKNKKNKNVDFEMVDEQLQEAEETVVYLYDLNEKLVKDIEECPSPDGKDIKSRRRKVTEEARKGTERIGRLQLELQKIQYILLKNEDEKKNKTRGKFFKSKTIVLRDFIYNGRKNSGKRKKGPLCGCFRASSGRNERSP